MRICRTLSGWPVALFIATAVGAGAQVAPALSAPTSTYGGAPAPQLAPAVQPVFNWIMNDGGPERYSYYGARVDVSRMALAWQFSTSAVNPPPEDKTAAESDTPPAPANLSPVVFNGRAYFAVGSSVYAVSIETGEQLWKAPYTLPAAEGKAAPTVSCGLAMAGEWLYVGGTDGVFHVINTRTGESYQDIQVDGSITASPAILYGGSIVVFGTDTGNLYAYQWQLSNRGAWMLSRRWSRAISPADSLSGPISMFQGTVYTTTREGKAFAVTASNGNVLFGHALDGASLIFGSVPSAAGIYTVSGPTLYLLNSFSLQIKWSMAFDSEITALPAYSPLQDILFLITQSGTLYAYQPGTRKLVWKQSLGLKSKAISSPLVVGDTVLVSTAAGHVYGFAARGDGYGNPALLWRYMAPAIPSYEFKHPWIDPDLAAQPVVYGQNLLLLAADGTLNCMSTTTIDEDGPTAEYRFPMYGPYPDNPIYAITARITDPGSGIRTLPNPGVGPAKGDVKMFLDGQSVLRLGGDFSYDVYAGKLKYKPATPYNEGTHLVEVQAVDNRGNFKSIKWTFDISKTAPPLEAPTTTGTTPGTPGQPGAGPGNP